MNTEYQQQEIELQRQSHQNSEDTNNQLFSIIFAIIYNFIWGILFYIFRHLYYEEECKGMNFWSFIAQIFLFSVAIYKLWKQNLFEITEKVEFVLSIIVLIGLSYAYFQFEDCYGLRNFVLFYLIVTYVVLGIYLISLLLLILNKSNNSG
ncbi:unnamed protein product [Paramecium primaurelia]|uniref:Transmembrane protein n=1 Tax=Paramecium primaurelia TaxID=5886 RepID=A0A8S1PK25_PARPR|nr:unnamed protein product [Paramecium primaurelia]